MQEGGAAGRQDASEEGESREVMEEGEAVGGTTAPNLGAAELVVAVDADRSSGGGRSTSSSSSSSAPTNGSGSDGDNGKARYSLDLSPSPDRQVFDSAAAIRTFLEGDVDGAVRSRRPLKVNVDLAVWRARGALRAGDVQLARRLYIRCTRLDPKDGRAYVALAQIEQRQRDRDGSRRVEAARKWLEDGCALCGGSNAHLWQALGVLEERAGDTKRARQCLEASIAADGGHAPGWHALGKLEERLGDKARAMEIYRRGISRCAPSEFLQQSLAMLEYEAGRPEDARAHFRGAVALDRGSAPSYCAWAKMEAELGDHEAAERIYLDGLAASPKNRFLWLDFAKWEAEWGRGENVAREHLRQGAELNPRDASLRQAMALLEARQGNARRAREWFRKAIVADSFHVPTWLAWGVYEWRKGDVQRARELFRRGLLGNARRKESARVLHAWGALEWRAAGSVTVARELFKAALRIDRTNMTVWDTWVALEVDEGDKASAAEVAAARTQVRAETRGVQEELKLLGANGAYAGGGTMLEQLKGLVKWAVSQNADAAEDAAAAVNSAAKAAADSDSLPRLAFAVQPLAATVSAARNLDISTVADIADIGKDGGV